MTHPIFVTPPWLAGHIEDPRITVVDASWYLPSSGRDAGAEYLQAHIPNAVRFDLDAVSDRASPLPHMLPTPQAFAAAVGALGISEDMMLIIYDGAGLFSAPRVRWMFRTFGVADVRILKGGLPRWRAAGLPLAAGPVRREPRRFQPALNAAAVADLDQVRRAVAKREPRIVDARSAARFTGAAPEPRPSLRSGHMPGAYNMPAEELIVDGALLPPEALAAVLRAHDISLDRPVITTCGSGVTAAIVSLALESLGCPPGILYDGSWAEWGGRDDCDVVADRS